ncbi:MAG TPA: IPT/TIG domain-containing protein [Clostridia bacterium]|nr:IPT/TIG domain-containing protein [Clostridia bacterium]
MKKYIILAVLIFSLSSCLNDIYPPLIITGTVTNIDKDGAVFHAKVTDLGIKDVIEFGFVWDTIQHPTIEKAEKYVFHEHAKIGNYEAKISTNLIALKTYYVRTFIRNEKVTTYGEETSFLSQGGKSPEILSISPALGNLGDTLVVVGKYFSTRSSVVKINYITATIIKSNQDSLYVKVPSTLARKTSAVALIYLNQLVVAKDSFTLISPIITNFETKRGTYGDEVTIMGKNFLENPSTVRVYFDKAMTTYQIIDDKTIKAIVPSELDNANCSIAVVMNNQKTESVDKYSLSPVEIVDFSPKTILTGGTITVSGKNFSPVLSKNKVYIGGVLAKSVSVSKNTLTVTLSLQDTAVYESRDATVKVDVGGSIAVFNDKLLINDKWFRRANAPLELRTDHFICSTCNPYYEYNYASSFVIGKIAYIGLHNKKDFWAYDTYKNSWSKLRDFPGTPRMYGTGFIYGNKIYFGTGMTGYYTSNQTALNDWWEYDTTTDSWSRKNDFPVSTYSSIGFSNNDGCFMSNGYKYTYNKSPEYFTYFLQAWKYNPENDSWNDQTIGSWADYNYTGMNFWIPCKSVGNEVYVNLGNREVYRGTDRMYIINSQNNTMKSIADFPMNVYSEVVSFYINGKVYIRKKAIDTYDNKSFYYYDESNNKWKFTQTDVYSYLRYGIAFEAGDIGFIGLGESNQMYEFDPNR